MTHNPLNDDLTPLQVGLTDWQQGDYTLAIREIFVADTWDGAQLSVITDPVHGLVVITQTCDIVNDSSGKEWVTVCPLVGGNEQLCSEAATGRTPAFATLETPPNPRLVVDLGRMMSLHKDVLARLPRRRGFVTDLNRSRFAAALERKHGRFAFPDKFSVQVLGRLRNRFRSKHARQESEAGKVYRSIQNIRAAAEPNWDAPNAKVTFYFVLEPEAQRGASREQIATTLDADFQSLEWPSGLSAATPRYRLVTLEEMTAAEWVASQAVDLDYLSWANASPRNAPATTEN